MVNANDTEDVHGNAFVRNQLFMCQVPGYVM